MIASTVRRAWRWLVAKIWGSRAWTCRLLEEVPDAPADREVYLIGEGDHLWSAAFQCPCGCGALIQLNILRDAKPRWEVTRHSDGTVSLYPSVWRQVGCRSHFVLRQGIIEWCRATVSDVDTQGDH